MQQKIEDSGSHCEYYHCEVKHPQNPNQKVGYIANCEDIIQALGLTFDEGCEFKSIWRRGRGRQGFVKAESTALRDAIKAVHYAKRVLALEERLASRIDDTCEATRVGKYSQSVWAKVPERYEWIATDSDGETFAYEVRPSPAYNDWHYNGNGMHMRLYDLIPPDCDWTESLERRP